MNWNYWGQKSLDACQQQWFFKNRYASALATKNPLRREAFLLSKLQNIYSWRGSLVDQVISEYIVPRIKTEWEMNEAEVIDYARKIFRQQIDFAFARRLWEPGMTVTAAGENFAAFFEVEYDVEITNEDLERAWADIEAALKNFLEMPELLNKLFASRKLIPQRTLDFSVLSAKAKAKPDLISFYHFEPPHIFDWKVHTFGVSDYRKQLATYALALERCKSKRDINLLRGNWKAADMRLYEVQLLTKQIREYKLTEDELDDLESQIVESYGQMNLLLTGRDKDDLSFDSLSPARYPETCEKCPFQKPCWGMLCEKSKQTTFLY